ncbi:sulfur carrier protein ThiS adenylyltransferase ThiF [Porcipelethomonas sp.]|uniref:sulfur carrier protein ThiS adenylyltransferase ThiF n=1 Tax=Porcipelethomonas sp. TaxID=2981675 RepID=UPI003EF531A9
MKIILNGKPVDISCRSLFEVRDKYYSSDCITILNGFQTSQDMTLNDNDTVNIIKKGVMPEREQLESLMAARHTPEVHKKVKRAKVAVCGLGGLGSNIAVMLARTGIGYLKLIDFDIVEPSNLNRQNYYIEHLGMNKTDALQSQIKKINPFIDVCCINEKITAENCTSLVGDCDIICEAFDNPESKAMLTETVIMNFPEKKLVCGSGMAGFDSSNKIITRKVMNNLYICGDNESEAKPGNGLMAPRVNVCAGHQANMILRLIMENDEP